MKFLFFTTLFFLSSSLIAQSGDNQMQTFKWGDLDVVWIERSHVPLYQMKIYFDQGALGDSPSMAGVTELAFHHLDLGTTRYTQEEIKDALDFHAVSYGANVTHEYSTFGVKGLIKDLAPTMKMMCHLFQEATYPDVELKRELSNEISQLKSLTADPSGLASRAFRQLSMQSTPYGIPVGGNLKSLENIKSSHLKARLNSLQKYSRKKLYLMGPKELLNLKEVLLTECRWGEAPIIASRSAQDSTAMTMAPQASASPESVHLLVLPEGNQAQIRIGRFLEKELFYPPLSFPQQEELMEFSSQLLGGGFTSILMQELRVKRGLIYSASSFAARQAHYGRSVIGTATKLESVTELIKVTKNSVKKIVEKGIDDRLFSGVRSNLMGSYPFKFEEGGSYLQELVVLDHLKYSYDKLYQFPDVVAKLQKKDVQKMIELVFSGPKQIILVVGPKSLKEQLEKAGHKKVLLHRPEEYL